jgi:hypothetical protein
MSIDDKVREAAVAIKPVTPGSSLYFDHATTSANVDFGITSRADRGTNFENAGG